MSFVELFDALGDLPCTCPDADCRQHTAWNELRDMLVSLDAGEIPLPEDGVNLRRIEREWLVEALERSAGSRTDAGSLLGLNRDQVRHRINKHNLQDKYPTPPRGARRAGSQV